MSYSASPTAPFDPAAQGWLTRFMPGAPNALRNPELARFLAMKQGEAPPVGTQFVNQQLSAPRPLPSVPSQTTFDGGAPMPGELPYAGPGTMDLLQVPVPSTRAPPAPPPQPPRDPFGNPMGLGPAAPPAWNHAMPEMQLPEQLDGAGPGQAGAASFGPRVAPSASPGVAADGSDAGTMGDYMTPGRLSKAQLDAQWARMVGGESGGNASARNPKTGALGLTQFIPSTLAAFLASPEGKGITTEDFKKSPEIQRRAFDWLTQQNADSVQAGTGSAATPEALTAAHALGAGGASALIRHPDQNAVAAYNADVKAKNGQVALISNNPAWGIKPDDTAGTALQKINAYYTLTSGGSSPAGPPSNPAAPAQAAPAQGDTSGGTKITAGQPITPPTDAATLGVPDTLPGYQPSTQAERYLALAGGILSGGPNLGQGLGAGIAAMQKMSTDDRVNSLKFAHEAASNALLKQRLGLVAAQTDVAKAKPGQTDRALDQKDDGLDIRRQQAEAATALATQRGQVQQGRLSLAQDNAQFLHSGMAALTPAVAKDSMSVAQGLTTDIVQGGEMVNKADDLIALIKKEGITGNDVRSRVQRFAAENLGVDIGVSPNGFSLADKTINDLNSSAVLGQAKGMISRLTQGEFNTLRNGFINMKTQPEAALAMLQTYREAAMRRLEIGQKWNALQSSDPAAATRIMSLQGGGLRNWYEGQVGGQLVHRGITSDPGAPSSARYEPTTSPTGRATWQHTSPSGLGFRFD